MNTGRNDLRRALRLLIRASLILLLLAALGGSATTAQVCSDEYCVYLPIVARAYPVDTTNPPQNWLGRFNLYRAAAGLPPVTEDASYSADLAKHVNYMLLNPDDIWHGETPGRPGYTPEGAQAAAESNLWFTGPNTTDATAIDVWMGSMHHRYGMLRPELTTTGYASGCNSQHCGFVLNVLRGLNGDNTVTNGVVYPGPDQRGVRTTDSISWQFDPYWGPDYASTNPLAILASAVLCDSEGESVPITTSTPDSYFNMVTATPDEPLAPGTTYAIEMVVNLGSQQLSRTWSFTTRYSRMLQGDQYALDQPGGPRAFESRRRP